MRNPNYNCTECGEAYYKRPSNKGTYCSWNCYTIVRERNLPPCIICNKKYARLRGDQKYCSRPCSNRGRRGIKYTGEQSKNKATKVRAYRERALLLYGEICSICGLGPEWNGMPLQLQVDHIDGNRFNSTDENLRVVCPNCHTQTDTYGYKNIRKAKPRADDGSSLEKNRG